VRHPIIAHFLIPPAVFLLLYRLPFDTPKHWARERRSVHWTNLAIVAVLAAESAFLGLRHVMMVQLPVVAVASVAGVWLFSLQHRFEGVVWARQPDWNPVKAAIEGSSYLKLPRLLQWFTGNIGFHHIHHLNPRIPNYRLEACHDAVPGLQRVRTLSWRDGLAATRLALWDEDARRAVRFSEVPVAM
jgi:omega-6 fatty acid desaturase (delta-12 desaturase)